MAKITWIGEGDSDPKEIGWGGHTFKKGEAVEVENEAIIAKARGNKHFKVEGGPKKLESNESTPAEHTDPTKPRFPKI